MSRKKAFIIFLIFASLILSACSSPGGSTTGASSPTAEEPASASFNAEKPTVLVETFNGAIDISVGNDNAVKVDVTKRGSGDTVDAAKADLKNIQVTMNQEGSTVHVVAKRTDRRTDAGNSGVAVKITVPSGASLDLTTSNASVTVAGALADVAVQNTNGAVAVHGATGSLTLSTSNGNITAQGGSGKLKLGNSNGTIEVTTTAEAQVDISNVNGSVRFNGSLASKSKNTLRTSNASVAVTLPAQSGFTLNAVTNNGKVTSDFVVGGDNKNNQQLKGTVGQNPQTLLNLNTSNADIEIHKGN